METEALVDAGSSVCHFRRTQRNHEEDRNDFGRDAIEETGRTSGEQPIGYSEESTGGSNSKLKIVRPSPASVIIILIRPVNLGVDCLGEHRASGDAANEEVRLITDRSRVICLGAADQEGDQVKVCSLEEVNDFNTNLEGATVGVYNEEDGCRQSVIRKVMKYEEVFGS